MWKIMCDNIPSGYKKYMGIIFKNLKKTGNYCISNITFLGMKFQSLKQTLPWKMKPPIQTTQQNWITNTKGENTREAKTRPPHEWDKLELPGSKANENNNTILHWYSKSIPRKHIKHSCCYWLKYQIWFLIQVEKVQEFPTDLYQDIISSSKW